MIRSALRVLGKDGSGRADSGSAESVAPGGRHSTLMSVYNFSNQVTDADHALERNAGQCAGTQRPHHLMQHERVGVERDICCRWTSARAAADPFEVERGETRIGGTAHV